MLEVSFQWDRSIQCIFPDRSRQHQRYCVFLQPLDENNRGRLEMAGNNGHLHKGRSDLPPSSFGKSIQGLLFVGI